LAKLDFEQVETEHRAMAKFTIGQRWISETEPELGLGILETVDRRQIRLLFPAANEARLYAPQNAPIKRVQFHVGDSVHSQSGQNILIEEVKEEAGIITYIGGGIEVPEMDLADSISFSKPEDRLIGGQIDQSSAFNLRYEAIGRQAHAKQSSVAGFVGGRIDLIPHQLYIASEVSNRYMPRVLLADEVGLGKTIEACLILHRLHLTGRAERILIVLPESLVHQWFIELLRRFNMWFTIIDEAHCESVTAIETGANPFNEEQLVICSIKTLLEHPRWAECALHTKWDMLVVDEAHHLEWTPELVSPEYHLVEGLTKKSHGLLLLTATPEQLGAEGHFARLRLLDPERYPDLEKFRQEQRGYTRVAAIANKIDARQPLDEEDIDFLSEVFPEYSDEELKEHLKSPQAMLEELVDHHGTGRVIFRNSRDTLKGFPQRKGSPCQLEPRAKLSKEALKARLLREFDLEATGSNDNEPYDFRHGPRIHWLANLLKKLGENDKVLLICRTREKVQAIHDALLEEINVKAALFHEELTLLQRDRNAAWFAEKDGAKILLCSEIGSEGRNFQFAQHLVLFDLPLNPELLEQRIGRLDRIGQTATIQIHIPYLRHSWTELLMRWHHEGLDGVEHSLKGGYAYIKKFGDWIRSLGPRYHIADSKTLEEADQLINESAAFRQNLEQKLSQGQDRLIALNSFREEDSAELVGHIRTLDADRTLDRFMNRIFDHFGVNVEDIDERSFRLEPGQLFTDSFPGLPDEGITVTCDRNKAIGREDIGFLTWDHPMVRGAIDLTLSSEKGNSSIVVWKEPNTEVPPILIEAIYVLESVAPPRLHVDRFLPPTPVRVLVDIGGKDYSLKFSHHYINAHSGDEEAFRLKQDPALLKALVPEMLRAAREHARVQKSNLLQAAMHQAHERLDGEANRLKELKKVNPNVREEEIRIAENVISDVTKHIAKAHLRLDAVRLILGEST
jgi:ATP-dependent helicase HepA